MKINEKHLAAFASSNAPIDREGYMLKKGEVNKANQKRWFILKGNLLFYFQEKGDREPIGVIILEGCCAIPDPDDALYGRTFTVAFGRTYGGRNYVLTCNSTDDMQAWVKSISCASYDYMKMMVQELQKQLEEVDLADRSSSFTKRDSAEVHVGIDAALLLDHGTSQKKQSVLVGDLLGLDDISIGAASQLPQQRVNPFNNLKPSKDEFSDADFEKTVEVPETLVGHECRGFEDMHRDFGEKILRLIPVHYANLYC